MTETREEPVIEVEGHFSCIVQRSQEFSNNINNLRHQNQLLHEEYGKGICCPTLSAIGALSAFSEQTFGLNIS